MSLAIVVHRLALLNRCQRKTNRRVFSSSWNFQFGFSFVVLEATHIDQLVKVIHRHVSMVRSFLQQKWVKKIEENANSFENFFSEKISISLKVSEHEKTTENDPQIVTTTTNKE